MLFKDIDSCFDCLIEPQNVKINKIDINHFMKAKMNKER